MKKINHIFISFFLVVFLFSCDIKQKDFYSILSDFFNITSITIEEETVALTNDGKSIKANRKTDIILEDNYYNSIIKSNNKEGYFCYHNDSFYYSYDDSFYTVDYKFNNIFEPLGLDYLFYESDYDLDGLSASKIFRSTDASEFNNLLNNVCLDFNFDYDYSIIQPIGVDIVASDKGLDFISVDLSHNFKEFKSIIRTISFSYNDIEKTNHSEDISSKLGGKLSTKYMVKTDDYLDTYMLEMMYQYGDSIYIKSGDFDMLIDAGQYEDGVNVNKILDEYCTDDVLDILVATHGHGDHVGGFSNKALDSVKNINLIVDYGYYSYDKYCNLRDDFIINGSDYYTAYECVKMINGASKKYKISEDLSIEILDTGQYAKEDEVLSSNANENDYSVVLLLTFKNNTYLYTGDISGDTGLFMDNLYKENITNVTVYKAAHHGAVSHNTNTQDFLNYINPEICLISAAIVDPLNPHSPQNVDYSYQHPSYAFLNRIFKAPRLSSSKNVYFNGTMGTIHIADNGTSIPVVTGLGAQRGYYINGSKVIAEENKKLIDTMFYKTI